MATPSSSRVWVYLRKGVENKPQLAKFIQRPSFCPIHCIKSDQISAVSESVLQRGVDVGVVTLLRTKDKRTLLTRRAQHLRIFPGIWVPPGGHVELGESLFEAGLRELHEETGLSLNPKECPGKIICLWESVYPPYLSRGLPTRHHIIVYMSISVDQCHDDLDKNIHLQRSEVEASAWLDEMTVQAIVATDEESAIEAKKCNLPENFL
uniref:m7GpppN-mRNA hydrolase NUDT17 n=1 Tax=Saccoglossus kowalevskii TaxID=10224 RepID=A0ABM0MUT4_SACKO|nr:PREDICTED: nucleoside diphosphate-linked moiety X motif 17-like [Saccoglossus kowalevskii]